MVCPHTQEIIHALKLVNFLVQVDNSITAMTEYLLNQGRGKMFDFWSNFTDTE